MPMSPNQYNRWRDHWAELKSRAAHTSNPDAEAEFEAMFWGVAVGIVIGIVLGIITA